MLYVCDLHVHIGRASNGQAVKITASRDLTFENIAREAAERKGIDVVGVVDCLAELPQRQPTDPAVVEL